MNLELDNEHLGVDEEGIYIDKGTQPQGEADKNEGIDDDYVPRIDFELDTNFDYDFDFDFDGDYEVDGIV